jgi:hypothetical protein
MTGGPASWARVASGQEAAPLPRSVMNSRRLMAAPKGSRQDIVAGQADELEVGSDNRCQCPPRVIRDRAISCQC